MNRQLLQEMVEKYGNMVYRLAWRMDRQPRTG